MTLAASMINVASFEPTAQVAATGTCVAVGAIALLAVLAKVDGTVAPIHVVQPRLDEGFAVAERSLA